MKKSVLLAGKTVLLALIGLVTQYFLVRFLTIGQYGTLKLILSWLTVLGFFSLGGFLFVIKKAAAQRNFFFFKTASKLRFIFSWVGSLVFLILGFYFDPNLKPFALMLAFFFPFHAGLNAGETFLLGARKFNKHTILGVSTALAVSVSQVLASALFQDVAYVIFFTLVATSLINLGVTLRISKGIKQKVNKEKKRSLTKYGFQLTGIGIIPNISSKIQFIILGTLASPEILAIYAIAQAFPEKIKTLFKNALSPYSIYLGSVEKDRSVRIVRKAMLLLFLVGLGITIFSIIILPFAIEIIFGQQYLDSIIYALLLVAIALATPVNLMITSIATYHEYKKFYAKITTVVNTSLIILYLLLIPLFQIYGIILTKIIVQLIRTTMTLVWFYKLPYKEVKKAVLTLDPKFKHKKYNTLTIDSQINSRNILQIIDSDYLLKEQYYPLWVKTIAKLTFSKILS